MRINKLLSNLGYCSRREANRWIEQGRLTVNGMISCQLGQWVEEDDLVLLDGQPLTERPRCYLLLNKPVGITCTAETDDPNNIIEYLNYPHYLFPVGRLDKDSQGLMMLTNDGELANQVLAAEHGHEKVYHVTVHKPFDDAFLTAMAAGVDLGGGLVTKSCVLERLSDTEFEITLSQGLNRQIRRMCQAFQYKVVKLERVSILNLLLGNLSLGAWRFVEPHELDALKKILTPTASVQALLETAPLDTNA